MHSECVPFTRIPHISRLFSDFLYHFDKVSQFYARSPYASGWIAERAAELDYDQSRRETVADILRDQNRLFGSSTKTMEAIERFRTGACAAVTGQQVGFLGGPLFALLKAISAVRLAAEASRRGVDCVPVFWLATADHDLEEVSGAVVQDGNGQLHTVSLSAEGSPESPMSTVRLSAEITEQVKEVTRILGDVQVSAAIREAYRPGELIGNAFGKLFASIFADYGVILLDPSDPRFQRIAKPIYSAAAEKAVHVTPELLKRGQELLAAGYHEQVKVTSYSTLLFATKDGARVPVHLSNGGFEIADEKMAREQLLERIVAVPEDFTPNVLLRPVVQDYLLPTLAYIGGPAEVAYFAQAEIVYQELLGRVTPVLPRFSATIVDSKAQRLLKRYQLDITDLFHGQDPLRERMASHSLPSDLQKAFTEAAALANKAFEAIHQPLGKLDPTLLGAADRAGSKVRYQLERLRTRAANAEVRQNEIINRHTEFLSSALFPHKNLQERVMSGASVLARYGTDILQGLYDAAATECPDHQVLFL